MILERVSQKERWAESLKTVEQRQEKSKLPISFHLQKKRILRDRSVLEVVKVCLKKAKGAEVKSRATRSAAQVQFKHKLNV